MLCRALSRIFTLNTKEVDTPEKIKNIIKIAIETTIKNMARTKATVGRLHVKTCHLPGSLVNGEYSKKKNSLPAQDKRSNTRRKSSKHHQRGTNNKNKCKKKI